MGRNHVLLMVSFAVVLYSNGCEAKAIISDVNYKSLESNEIIEDTETNTTKSMETFPLTDIASSTIWNENNDNSRAEIPKTTISVEPNSLSYNFRFPNTTDFELISNSRIIPITDTVQNTTEKFTPSTISSSVTFKNNVSVEIHNTSTPPSMQAKYTDSVSTTGISSTSSALLTTSTSAPTTSWYTANITTTSSPTTTSWYPAPNSTTTSSPTTTSWYPTTTPSPTTTSSYPTPNPTTTSSSTTTSSYPTPNPTTTSSPTTTSWYPTTNSTTITGTTPTRTIITTTFPTSAPLSTLPTTIVTTSTTEHSTTTSTRKPTSTTSKPGKNVLNFKFVFNWNCSNTSNCSLHF